MRTALVTGASSGIGKATAKRLLNDGFRVYCAARRIDRMDDLKELGAIPIKLDVTIEEDCVRAVDQIIHEAGAIDVLINNAGFGLYGPVETTTIEDARYQFEVNLFGLARLTQLVLPHMRKRRSGRIINTSSMGGKIYTPLGAWYHATKHAVEGWSDCLRLELKQFNIHISIIEPGIIGTEFGDVLMVPLNERTKGTEYQTITDKLGEGVEKSYKKGAYSSPDVIAKVMSKAALAKKPKTRYVAGKLAKPLMFIRKWFGDRIYDRMIMSQFS